MENRFIRIGRYTFDHYWMGILILSGVLWNSLGQAVLNPAQIYPVNSKKLDAYLRDGLVVGGDRNIENVTVRNIRRASNPKYERLVIDLELDSRVSSAGIERPPYYQVAIDSQKRRLVFTFWGKPHLAFSSQRVIQDFKRSSLIENIELFPRLEDHWIFSISFKSAKSVEIFELTQPLRVIADIKTP